MDIVRPSSVEEYASWYLQRESCCKEDPRPIPEGRENQVQAMRDRHPGKMRSWFTETTRGHIVRLQAMELKNVVFLECDWTKREKLIVPGEKNYRILERVAKNAIASGYLARQSAHRHKCYYDRMASGALSLQGEERVAICSAEESEIQDNPRALYYLLDGVGRCLPYMILVIEQNRDFAPVEAFLAER